MDEKRTTTEDTAREGWERFQRLARALFRVDRRDVEKHQPKKRLRDNQDSPINS